MANKITCTCGHSWDKSDSSKKDASVCHICGKDNAMKNGGWLDKFEAPQAQNGIEGTMGGLTDEGFNYNGAWGGPSMEEGGAIDKAQLGTMLPASLPLSDLVIKEMTSIGDMFSSSNKIKDEVKTKPKTKPYTIPGEIKIKDLRKTRKTTGKPINPNVDLVSGKYDTSLIQRALEDAKKHGLSKEDAWNLAAIGFQESGWGKTDSNLGHISGGNIGEGATENQFVNAYLNKMKEADRLKITDPELRLQVYNGLGMIKPETEQDYHGFKMKKIYGVPVPDEGLNMRKNPLYGRQVIDIRDNVLRQNQDVVSYIDSLYGEEAPKKAMGGSIPGAVGFTYARTQGSAPANGKYTKKTKASAQNGAEMSFYQNGLDWKPRNISRDGAWLDKYKKGGDIKKDDMGYWNPENWGEPVEISSPYITMEGVYEPLLGISDTGDVQMMYPGEDYEFDGETVTEYPISKNGGWLDKYEN